MRRSPPLARLAAPLACVLALAAAPAGARAQIVLLETDDATLGLSGYLRALTGFHDRGFDLPAGDRRSVFHAEVLRVKWRLEAGRYVLDVHQRLQASVASGAGEGPALGFGVSVLPGRAADLSSDLASGAGYRVWHDIDRLSLSARTPIADFTVGRQPVTWGTSAIFPVADLWAAFSPFELDTEEKPGIDAVRALFYPADGLEMDAVVADRGDADHLSAGLRATWSLPSADLWAGAGKLWDRAVAMAGVTVLFEETRVRAEGVFPVDERPRATAGVDWIRGRLSLTGEAHYNGAGADDPADYAATTGAPAFQRGETYFLGRTYLGAAASWSPDEQGRIRLALSALLNAGDGSAALTPIFDYDLGPATSVSAGALVSFGETPVLLPPAFRSEFGAYGDMLFTRVSLYF